MSAAPVSVERAPNATRPALAVDLQLMAIVATFLALGLLMVFSASYPVVGPSLFMRQLQWVALGSVVFFGFTFAPYRWWQRLALPIMLLTLAGLIAVLVLNMRWLGASRGLAEGRFQPSEAAKLAVTIYLAAWATARRDKLKDLGQGILPFAVILGLVCGLILLERSISVTLIVMAIGVAIFFVGGGRPKHLALMFVIALPILILVIWQSEYPMDRIRDWYAVWFNPSEVSQNTLRILDLLQAGQGIGTDPASWQAKAAVPLLWSDYLFANIGNDLSWVGLFGVVGLYGWFGYRALSISLNAPDRFGYLAGIGVMAWVVVQAGIHIGTSLALIPQTGQPLPFMSYGGSSLLSVMAAAGLLASVSRQATEKKSIHDHYALWGRNGRARVSGSGRSRSSESHDGRTRRFADERVAADRSRRRRSRSIARRVPLRGRTGQY